jgi:hypothetical protein
VRVLFFSVFFFFENLLFQDGRDPCGTGEGASVGFKIHRTSERLKRPFVFPPTCAHIGD